jgi:hypothetical protein
LKYLLFLALGVNSAQIARLASLAWAPWNKMSLKIIAAAF